MAIRQFPRKMKTQLTVLTLVIVTYIMAAFPAYSQVTIGQNETPEKYATLQIKDKVIDRTGDLDAATADKGGLLLPRVELKMKKELLPFVTQAEVEADPQSQDYLDSKELHTGLIVYNLTENDEEDLCFGVNQWDGEQWNCLQNKLGNAIAELGNCDSLRFMGVYQNDVMLDGSNYMLIPLHVKKTGAYTVTAIVKDAETNTNDNGYFFNVTGVFMSTGYYYIKIDGAGTPIEFTPSQNLGDYVTVTFNNEELSGATAGCQKRIFVEDSSVKPLYKMDCWTVRTHGFGILDKELLPSRALGQTTYITVDVEVEPAAVGAFYEIETNKVAGMSFYAKGNFTASGRQTITLEPVEGSIPNATDYHEFIISTNSISTNATCKATVLVAYTKKKLLTLSDCWSKWQFGPGEPTSSVASYYIGACRKILKSSYNFGVEDYSTVKVEEIDVVQYGSDNDDGPFRGPYGNELKDIIERENISIIQFSVRYNLDDATAQVLLDFMNNGGVVIAMMDKFDNGAGPAQILLRKIFNNNSITISEVNGAGALYQLTNKDDDILNGPFGDARGRFWGEDSSVSLSANGLPEDDIVIYSYDQDYSQVTNSKPWDPGYVGGITMFRHKTLPFFWIGDGGFLASEKDKDDTSCPLDYSDEVTCRPVSRYYGRSSTRRRPIYNSQIWGNLLYWAIKATER